MVPVAGLLGFVLFVIAVASDGSNGVPARCNVDPQAVVVDANESEFIRLLNDLRAENGFGPVSVNAALTRAATWMATDLAASRTLGGVDSLGRDPSVRILECGYGAASATGEASVTGHTIPVANRAFSLMAPLPHFRSQLLNGEFTEAGIARAGGDCPDGYGHPVCWYWTVTLGSPEGEPAQ